eukprot:TRINITY_DN8336_c0_g1_i1.p1 TRINITY_DN8336_c0_g1~~TRINITY_DN8336_c0_g1_i1.p1  ORF type:complete len:617 (+),score=168.47 TRINITY_DN8336_c0_g1_i1:139-1989(+)
MPRKGSKKTTKANSKSKKSKDDVKEEDSEKEVSPSKRTRKTPQRFVEDEKAKEVDSKKRKRSPQKPSVPVDESESASEASDPPAKKKKKAGAKKRKIEPATKRKAIPLEELVPEDTITGGPGSMTYVGMIHSALESMGGEATLPDITSYIQKTFADDISKKTKTWKNSIAGCLSTHFGKKEEKDEAGKFIWTIERIENPSKPRIPKPPRAITLESEDPAESEDIAKPKKRKKVNSFDSKKLARCREENSDFDLEDYSSIPIKLINKENPLKLLTKLNHSADVFSMSWSNDASMLATVSNLGTVRIWNTDDWQLLKEILDKSEKNIIDYYSVCFTPDDAKVIVGGRSKSRKKWSDAEEDNEVMPSPIKIFDVQTGALVLKLEGHREEILSVRTVEFDEQQYIVSTGQDGLIIKWHMNDDYSELQERIVFAEHKTDVAIYSCFLTHTGKKFMLAACDDSIKVFDFEAEQEIQTFPKMYGYLCDCIRVIDYDEKKKEWTILTKGVETLDDDGVTVMTPNSCHLRKLKMEEDSFSLEIVHTFQHEQYHSNMWMTKFATNGRYILSPTTEGKVFIWNIQTKALVAVMHDHGFTLRDILFHPTQKVLSVCGDDGVVLIYEQS